MNLNTLKHFRHAVYGSLTKGADALFNTMDALVSEPQAHSFPELSLSPFFQRQWCSLYEAFEDGRIDRTQLRQVLAAFAPQPEGGHRMWIAVDASTIARPQSETARDRTPIHIPNLPHSTKAMTVGWQFSTVVILPEEPSSWTYVLDMQRIASSQTATQVAAQQILALLPLLQERVIVTADRWYGSAQFLLKLSDAACDQLLRLKSNRVLYRPAPARTGKRGAPRKDGARFACGQERTHGMADEQWEGTDEHGHPLIVSCWHHLHFQQARALEVTVIKVVRPRASERKRDPKVSWFLWHGNSPLPLSQVYVGYKRRYAQEHGYRFEKQALLWETPRLRTPEQFERWTDVVAVVHDQLHFVRHGHEKGYRPWENQGKPVTPQQVRRAMPRILAQVGTPARPPQRRGKSPGRSYEALIHPAPRYEVVRKAKKEKRTS